MGLCLKELFVATLLVIRARCAASPRAPAADTRHVVRSALDPRVSVSYKQTRICETTPGVKAYSGYVNLPANLTEGRAYDIHTFFWFVEARKNPQTAPLSLWLQGGPGAPSSPAVVGENGPCSVNRDSATTSLSQWSWTNEVNMLYLDQPVQTGFSYDTLINGAIDETDLPYVVIQDKGTSPPPAGNSTFLRGTFSSQNFKTTANTTVTAALAAWNFLQVWLQQFPQYKPKDNKISIWSESYGGHYGPSFARFFSEKSKGLTKSTNPTTASSGPVMLRVDTVGILNGCIDMLTQMPSYPQMAYNNTYGIQVITEAEYNESMAAFPACRAGVEACQALAGAQDPTGLGNMDEVNKACSLAYNSCFSTMRQDLVDKRGRNVYDITETMPLAFPPKYAAGYLNSKPIQDKLGVPINITGLAMGVWKGFMATGDFVLGKNLAALGELLDQGVKVALVHGDRDYQCNWLGGEQISLAIQSRLSSGFRAAGYANIQTNKTYVGGVVRQFGNLSFSRVFQAGHESPWYQPETVYQIFKRAMFNTDIATGKISTAGGTTYSSSGPSTVFDIRNAVPVHPRAECYLWDVFQTCTPDQKDMLKNGTAILKDYIMIGFHLADGTAQYY